MWVDPDPLIQWFEGERVLPHFDHGMAMCQQWAIHWWDYNAYSITSWNEEKNLNQNAETTAHVNKKSRFILLKYDWLVAKKRKNCGLNYLKKMDVIKIMIKIILFKQRYCTQCFNSKKIEFVFFKIIWQEKNRKK